MTAQGPGLSLQDGGTLRDFISRIEQGIYIVTPDGRIVDANPALLDIFGAASVGDLQQFHSEDLVPDPAVREKRRRLLADKGWIRGFRYRIRCLDGSTREVRDTVFAQRDDHGRIIALHGILDPVDNHSDTDHGDHEPLSSFFTGAPAGLAILDTELRFLRINQRLAEMHVLPAAAHVGRALSEVLPGLSRFLEPVLREVLSSGVPAVNVELPTEDPRAPGRARVWRLAAFPVGPARAEPTAVGIVVIDITDAKRQEEQARLDGRYMAALIESCPLAMVTLDPASRVVAVNAAFEELFQLPRAEAIGHDLDELIAPRDKVEEARLLTERAQHGERLHLQVRRRRRNGDSVLLRAHASPIVLDGQHVGAHVIYEGIGAPGE
ncbi:MAG: PAS domain-containing protein [Acidobacteriota bacterium]